MGRIGPAREDNGVSIAEAFPREVELMRVERRREPRYPFIARAEIVDEKENARTSSRVSDLSRHGCYVEMMNPFPQGTTVLIEIYTEEEFLEAHGTVAFFEPKQGMGLTFDEMPPYFAGVLEKWLEQANGKNAN
jgi:hypothetical protein